MFVFVAAGFAQSPYAPQHREWEVSGFGGVSYVRGFQFSTPVIGVEPGASTEVGMEYADGYQVGLRLTQNLGDFAGAGLEYSFANQPLRFNNLSPSIQSLSLGHSINHFSYDVSFLPVSPLVRLRPYGKIGAGASLYYIHEASKDEARALGLNLRDSWEFTVNLGGGVKYLVMDEFAVIFDFKDQISGIPTYGLPSSARVTDGQFQPGFSRDGLFQNWQFNLGIAFQWDER
jgi:hypothetical protein